MPQSIAPAPALLLTQLIVGAVVLAIPGLMAVPALTVQVVGLTVVSAGCSMLGNLLLIIAYGCAAASRLAPFVYTQLIWATLCGFVIFGVLPDQLALLGLFLLLASGLASLSPRLR